MDGAILIGQSAQRLGAYHAKCHPVGCCYPSSVARGRRTHQLRLEARLSPAQLCPDYTGESSIRGGILLHRELRLIVFRPDGYIDRASKLSGRGQRKGAS